MAHALVVDDDGSSLAALLELVEQEGFRVGGAATLSEARAELERVTPAVVLTDLVLPDGSGLDLVTEVGTAGQVVLITGHASVDTAVEALRNGAVDYLTKPLDIGRLKAILANVARTQELQEEIGALRGELRKLGRFGPLVGSSAAMGRVYDLVVRVAPTDATVCVVGESGTGKEVVAQAVHELSRRRRGPFVPLNCGAVAPNLIETTLFGHEKGSFTGAERQHRGVFEQAGAGTLFLDEVTEMPAELQVKLLRVLETATVMRVGGEQLLAVDVRVIAATNRVPEEAVAEGKLREDLWYRLKVFPIELPPLRARERDVEVLAAHFLDELNAANGTAKQASFSFGATQAVHTQRGDVMRTSSTVRRPFEEFRVAGFAETQLPASILHPLQFAAIWSGARHSPERELAAAVIENAISDLRNYRLAGRRRRQRLYMEAYEWVTSEDREWPFSFVNHCEYLKLSPDALRQWVLRDPPERKAAEAA